MRDLRIKLGRALHLLTWSLLLLTPVVQAAEPSIPLLQVSPAGNGTEEYSVSLQALGLMTLLTLLPGIVLAMTSFTRIIVVLSLLRQALGTAQTPPNAVLVGLAFFMTLFVMAPTLQQIQQQALTPYMEDRMPFERALDTGVVPLKQFMLAQTRDADVRAFMDMAELPAVTEPMDLPLNVLVPAFMTSELKTAFQIGFLLFIPFIVIDLIVASVLMSMGMMMVSPMIISLPFKLLLFVLVDGWSLVMGSIINSFQAA